MVNYEYKKHNEKEVSLHEYMHDGKDKLLDIIQDIHSSSKEYASDTI